MLQLSPSWYRARVSLDIIRGIVLPSVVLNVILRYVRIDLGLFNIPTYIGFIAMWMVVRAKYLQWRLARDAYQLGAKPIPCVVGKWPGNIDVLLRMLKAFKTSYLLDVYRDLFEEYQCTTLNTRLLWVDHIITMDQKHCQFILATGFENFWRGRSQKERMETFLGRGIFNRDDTAWKMHRAMARPFFARERLSDFDIFERQACRTLSIISSLASSNTACEAQDLYGRFTLDSASEFLFGKNLDTLSGALPDPRHAAIGPKGSVTHDSWGSFAQAFEMIQQVITARSRIGYFWPLFELLKDRTSVHAATIREWLDPLVDGAILEQKQFRKAGVLNTTSEISFLQHLAGSTEDGGMIRDQLLNILLASRDTTACLLTIITYFMAMQPEIASKLREEVLEVCGTDAAPNPDSIKKLKYMRAVINEALRLFPPVPLNVRESRDHSFTIPSPDPTYPSTTSDSEQPLYMPANTGVMYMPFLTQRNPVLWGPDVDVFDPERWLDPERIAKFTANPTMYSPFSAGPRFCVGQSYAFNEASYFLVRLLQKFDTFTLAPDIQPPASLPPPEWKNRQGRQSIERMWPSAALTMYIKGGLWVRFGNSSGAAYP